MPLYSGNLYNPSNAQDVALNTQKAQPSSLFGTRNLKFFTFSIYFSLYSNSNNFFDNAISVTGGSADGTHVTYEFAYQEVAPYAAGDTIFVTDMTYGRYNGEYTVVSATNSSVTVAWFESGEPVAGGRIVRANYNDPDSFYSYIVRAIQKVAEVYYVSAPSYKDAQYFDVNFGNFVFAISDDLTTSDDYEGYEYPSGYGANEIAPQIEGSSVASLASALKNAMDDTGGWGGNGDGWSVAFLDDLGWGFAPGKLAGSNGGGWSLANPQS